VREPVAAEDLGGDALVLADDPEEDVLGPDVVVTELERLPQRELEHLLGAGRERDVAGRDLVLARPDDLLDGVTDPHELDPEGLERLGAHAGALADQAEEDVLGPDVAVVQRPRLLLGEDDDAAGSVGESLEHVGIVPPLTRRCFR
jgi:hypothetical protein